MGVHEHRAKGPTRIRVAILTLSDTRTEETDESGRLLREGFAGAGHDVVAYAIVRDDPDPVRAQVVAWTDGGVADVVVTTGGTGVAPRDRAVEALSGLFDKTLEGFGEIFRRLSFDEIGAAAMLSRAVAGTRGRAAIFVLPGSAKAVRLAMEKLLLPEVGHVVGLLTK